MLCDEFSKHQLSEMSVTDFICAALRNKNVPSQNFQKSDHWPLKKIHRPWYQLFILFILKLIIYPPERGEITKIQNVAARPGGAAVTDDIPRSHKPRPFCGGGWESAWLCFSRQKDFLWNLAQRISALSNWILISSSAVEVVSPDLICFRRCRRQKQIASSSIKLEPQQTSL